MDENTRNGGRVDVHATVLSVWDDVTLRPVQQRSDGQCRWQWRKIFRYRKPVTKDAGWMTVGDAKRLQLRLLERRHDVVGERVESKRCRRYYPLAENRSVLYCLWAQQCERFKIGFTTDLKSRYRAISNMSPESLVLFAYKPGTVDDEKRWHKRFQEHRTHGEWFKVCPQTMAAVEREWRWR